MRVPEPTAQWRCISFDTQNIFSGRLRTSRSAKSRRDGRPSLLPQVFMTRIAAPWASRAGAVSGRVRGHPHDAVRVKRSRANDCSSRWHGPSDDPRSAGGPLVE